MAVPLTDIEPLRPVLSQRPLGILSDIDGTISPIAARPEEAFVPGEICRLLGELSARGVFIALVTGRPLEEARRRVRLDGIAYAGNHGLELWVDGRRETAPGVGEYVEKARAALADLSRLDLPHVWVEDKGPVIGVHYRQSAEPQAARQAILSAMEASAAAKAFRIHEGKKIVELRPRLVGVDKGSAACALAQRFRLQGVLCLGDDTTDADMFRAVRGLCGPFDSAQGRLRGPVGACIAVDGEEASPLVLEAADYVVQGVEGVEWLLGEVVTAI